MQHLRIVLIRRKTAWILITTDLNSKRFFNSLNFLLIFNCKFSVGKKKSLPVSHSSSKKEQQSPMQSGRSPRSSLLSTKEGMGIRGGSGGLHAIEAHNFEMQNPLPPTDEDHDFFVNVADLDDFNKVDYKEFLDSLDVRVSNECYNRIIMVEYVQMFLAMFGTCISVVLNELSFNEDISIEQEWDFMWYIVLSTAVLIFAIYIRYDLYLKWYVTRSMLTEYDTLISTGWWQNFLLESAIMLIQPYPFLMGFKYYEVNTNWNVTISYEINQIIMCIMFARVYIILRFTLVNSKFMNPRSQRVCVMNGCEAEEMFAIKSLMKQMPFIFISAALVFSIVGFGY